MEYAERIRAAEAGGQAIMVFQSVQHVCVCPEAEEELNVNFLL